MNGSRPRRPERAVLLAAALVAGSALARADETPPPVAESTQAEAHASSSRWWSMGVLSGTAKPDGALADYQWDTTPGIAWGAQALAGTGPWTTGVRFWSARTVQTIGLDAPTANVNRTSWEAIGQARLATWWGNELSLGGSAGRMHLSYRPDRVSIDVGTGTPVDVELRPIDTWVLGGGAALRRTWNTRWTLGLEVDRRAFSLETAHRNGATIEMARESFDDWSAQVEFARTFGRR